MAETNLGIAMAMRREELGLSKEAVARRGGPHSITQRAIETGKTTHLRSGTIRGLEKALDWRPGSVEAVLAGREPTPITRPSTAPAHTPGPDLAMADALANWFACRGSKVSWDGLAGAAGVAPELVASVDVSLTPDGKTEVSFTLADTYTVTL